MSVMARPQPLRLSLAQGQSTTGGCVSSCCSLLSISDPRTFTETFFLHLAAAGSLTHDPVMSLSSQENPSQDRPDGKHRARQHTERHGQTQKPTTTVTR